MFNWKTLKDSPARQEVVSKKMSYEICKTSSTTCFYKPSYTKSKKCVKVQKTTSNVDATSKNRNRIILSKSSTASQVASKALDDKQCDGTQPGEGIIKNGVNQFKTLALLDVEKKFKVCACGDTILIEDTGHTTLNDDIVNKDCTSSKTQEAAQQKGAAKEQVAEQEAAQQDLSCNQSNDSITDSGCKSYSQSSGSQNRLVAENLNVINILPQDDPKKYDFEDLRMCIGDPRDLKRDFDGDAWYKIDKITDNLRDIFMEILESNSQVTKLVQGLPDHYRGKDANDEKIVDEIKKTIEKEINIENQLNNFLKVQNQSQKTEFAGMPGSYDFKHLDETISTVKDSLIDIKTELSEFKVNCWDQIERKASKTEVLEVEKMLKTKIATLEAKMSTENLILRRDFHDFKEKRKRLCGSSVRNFPVWPFMAFLGAYTIMCYGNKS